MLKTNRRDAGTLVSLFCWYEFDIIFISHGMHGFFFIPLRPADILSRFYLNLFF